MRLTFFAFLCILSLHFTSCKSQYQRVLQGDNHSKQLEHAERYYKEGEYQKALPLLSKLLEVYRGTSEAEKIYYYYSGSLYGIGENLRAAFNFKRLSETFPNGQYAEESAYMYAYCMYLESPKPSLDQTNTKRAIQGFQSFINRFPGSDRVEHASSKIDLLNQKLITKEFSKASLYYQIMEFQAAIWALRSFIEDYPMSEYNEEAQFLIVKSHYELAGRSVERRQLERYQDTLRAYEDFMSLYPDSKFQNKLTEIEKKVTDQINQLQTN